MTLLLFLNNFMCVVLLVNITHLVIRMVYYSNLVLI